jgi:phospholipid/cholesterol/gamma-HCH transport system substrate-binding protein
VDHRVPRVGLALAVVCSVLAIISFIALNEAFEGPSPTSAIGGNPYELKASFADSEGLPTKQPVLVHGVQVGKVVAVDFDHTTSKATVTFTVDDAELGPVHADATVSIGERTLLGDPFLDLDPGSATAPDMPSGGSVRALGSVDFDEALSFLDAKGRRHLGSTLSTLGNASASPEAGGQLNSTTGELARTIGELRDLTDALHGQEDEISGLVRDSATVVGELGDREEAIRSIVASGRATLDALATNTDSISIAVRQLPAVLETGTEALRGARPLLQEAQPLLAQLRDAAPDLAPAISDLGPLASDTIEVVKQVSGLPTLRKILRVVVLSGPSVPGLEAAVRNLVPLLRYAAPRSRGIVSFFSNLDSVTAHGDPDGAWARFAILFDPGELSDNPEPATCRPEDDIPVNTGFCQNAYPKPGDATDPEPYEPGSYPHLKPFTPPPADTSP